MVSNNFVVAQGASAALTCNYNANLTLAFNSVNSSGGGYGLMANVNSGGQALTVKDNVLYCPSGPNAFNISSSGMATVVIDYNDYVAIGPTVATWNGNPLSDLPAIKAATGQDAHSLFTPPGFNSSTDLHTNVDRLDGAGTPVAGITTDIDGQSRNATHPDIGADEYTRPAAVDDVPAVWHFAAPSPNPSRSQFRIGFDLPSAQRVRFALFDVAGRQVLQPLANHAYAAGRYSIQVHTEALSPGLYFCRINAGPYGETSRVVIGR
jgi:hypothetical protein